MQGHTGSVYSLSAKAGSTGQFYSTGGDGMLVLWDEANPDSGQLLAKVDSQVFSMLSLPDRHQMLLGQMQGGIHVLDMDTRREVRHLALHKGGVFDLQRLNDRQVVAAGGDGTLSVWDVEGFQLAKQIPLSDQSLRCIAIHPTQSLMAVGCSDHAVYLLDTQLMLPIQRLEGHANSVFSACFSPDGQWLLTGSRDAQLRVWNVAKNSQLYRQIPAHLFTINSIVYSPDGRMFATASRDKTIKLWDVASFDLLKVIDHQRQGGHVNSVNKLIWPNHLVSCSDDRSIMVWHIAYQNETL